MILAVGHQNNDGPKSLKAKMWIIMKLTIVLLFFFTFQVSARSDAQKITIIGNDVHLAQLFRDIERQTGYLFFYDKDLIQKTTPIDINIKNASLEQALSVCLKNQPLTYAIVKNTIVIKAKQEISLRIKNSEPLYAALPPIQVHGQVNDQNGNPLSNASVTVKGTLNGVTTNSNGQFSIVVPNNKAVLVISFTGFVSQEIEVANRTTFKVILVRSDNSLNEVVVTALGIKREAKSLGYATASVSHDELTVNRTTNFINTLEGKVAGVNITPLGSGPAGTSKIRLRGQSSFGGNNSPLIVVNGVPIDNTNFAAEGDESALGTHHTSDGGDGLNSINPDDIESMTILKGAPAAALYGSRAKDGVIMITTKQRKIGSGIGVEYNANYTQNNPLDYTDYQYEYGQGENGVRPKAPNPLSGEWSFGEKFEPGMTQVLFDGVTVPYVPQRNHIKDYYRKGNSLSNSVSVSSGNEYGGFNLSISNTDADAIVPGSNYSRKTVSLGFIQTLAKKLTISGNMNYSNDIIRNPPNIAEQDYSPVVIFNLANSMPLDLLKKYATDKNGNEFAWSRFTDRTNPYFALTRFDNINRDRIFGNLTARYNFTDWLYLQGRLGQDYYTRNEEYNLPTGAQRSVAAPPGFVNGEYVQDLRRFREINTDLLLGANRKFGDIGVELNVGGNQMYRKLDRNSTLVNDFYTRGHYTLSNGRQLTPSYSISERQVNSIYGTASLSYKGYLYVNGTARNDWFSTLSPANRSILYPSLSGSFIFSQLFSLPEWINFGKIRAAYAEVGSDTDVPPYSNNLFYSINSVQFPNPSGAPQSLATINGSVVPNPNLRPMHVNEKEIGLEMRLFNNRIGFELTYYNKLSSDQILNAQISDASGYINQLINVGQSRNKGLEMMLDITPISNKNIRWNANFNASYNTSEVLSLGDDVSDGMITVGTGDYTGELRQVVGKPIGQLFGYGYLRDENGNQVFDNGNGRPLRTPVQVDFGSAIPVWVGGITNSFNYKGINFSFLIDFKLGNKMISGTNFNAWRHGLAKPTLVGRDQGYVIGNGVNLDGKVNTTQSGVQAFYETVRSQNIAEQFVYNAGLWQLRQISIGYDFTKYFSNKLRFIKGLRLNAIANNVAVLKKWVPNIHPEQFGFASDNLVGLESTGLPITRNIGFNLNVKF